MKGWEDASANKLRLISYSCLRQTPLHLHSPPPPLPPPQLAPFKRRSDGWWRSALCKDELQLLLLLFVCLCLSPSPSSVTHWCVFHSVFCIFSEAPFFVGVTPLNGTMQPSVKLKLLVSLQLFKRGFYTCMLSSSSHVP